MPKPTPTHVNQLAELQKAVSAARRDGADFFFVLNSPKGYQAVMFAADSNRLAEAAGHFLKTNGFNEMLQIMQPPVTLIDLDVLATGDNEYPAARPVIIKHGGSYYIATDVDTDTPESFAFQAMEMLDDMPTIAARLRTIGNMTTHFERALCLGAATAIDPTGDTISSPEGVGEEGGYNVYSNVFPTEKAAQDGLKAFVENILGTKPNE